MSDKKDKPTLEQELKHHYKRYGSEKSHYVLEILLDYGIDCYYYYYSGFGYAHEKAQRYAQSDRVRLRPKKYKPTTITVTEEDWEVLQKELKDTTEGNELLAKFLATPRK